MKYILILTFLASGHSNSYVPDRIYQRLAMTLLHCLHCVLRREAHDTGPDESAEFEDAIGWVDLPNVTAMILVRLHAIHLALDSVSLRHALEVSES
jgi:hypothetical protein